MSSLLAPLAHNERQCAGDVGNAIRDVEDVEDAKAFRHFSYRLVRTARARDATHFF